MIKIFRRDPQLALDVPNVMKDPANVPVGRAVLRREAQLKARRLNGAGTPTARTDATTPSPPTDSSVVTSNNSVSTPPRDSTSMVTTTGAHHDKLMWAKVMASKAHAEATNIAKRMGKIEELEKGMALLEKMRPIYPLLERSSTPMKFAVFSKRYQTSKPSTVLSTSSTLTALFLLLVTTIIGGQ